MLPKDWKLRTLGEICSGQLQTGPFGSQLHASEYQESGVAVLMPKDLINYQADLSNAAMISIEKAKKLEKHALQDGDLLFSRRGDVSRFALIDHKGQGAICGTGCLRARPNSNHCGKFLSYVLQRDSVKTWLEQNAVGQTMLNLNTTILSQLPLLSASCVEEEIQISNIISYWDKAITQTQQLIEAKQKLKRGLMQQLLTGKARFPEYVQTNETIKTTFYTYSRDWSHVRISNIAWEISERNTEGEDLTVLSCSKYDGFVNSLAYFGKKVYSDDTSNYKVIQESQFGFPSNHIEEGSIGLLRHIDKGIVSPIYTIFEVDQSRVNPEFLYLLLKTETYRHIFSSRTSASVDRRGSLRWKEFSKIRVPLPQLEEQNKLVRLFRLMDSDINSLKIKLNHFEIQKQGLMQVLLTGKVRVSVGSKA